MITWSPRSHHHLSGFSSSLPKHPPSLPLGYKLGPSFSLLHQDTEVVQENPWGNGSQTWFSPSLLLPPSTEVTPTQQTGWEWAPHGRSDSTAPRPPAPSRSDQSIKQLTLLTPQSSRTFPAPLPPDTLLVYLLKAECYIWKFINFLWVPKCGSFVLILN